MEPQLIFGLAGAFSVGVLSASLAYETSKRRLTSRYQALTRLWEKGRRELALSQLDFEEAVEREVKRRIDGWGWETTAQDDFRKAEYMALRREQENSHRVHPHREDAGPNGRVHRVKTRPAKPR